MSDAPRLLERQLRKAALEGSLDAVNHLLIQAAHQNVNATQKRGKTALMLAAGKGHGDVVAALLEASAEVNATDDEGLTALLRAERKGHGRVAAQLAAAGAVLTRNDYGELLVDAAMENKVEAVINLVTKGVDINYADSDGFTALIWGGYNGDIGVVTALLAANADVSMANVDGITALSNAVTEKHFVIEALLRAVGAMGADGCSTAVPLAPQQQEQQQPDQQPEQAYPSQQGRLPVLLGAIPLPLDVQLFDAVADCDLGAVNSLLLCDALHVDCASTNPDDEEGWTALLEAINTGHVEIVKALLAAGAEVNRPYGEGNTPLYNAIEEGQDIVAAELCAAGAVLNAHDQKSMDTELLVAATDGDVEEVGRLLIAGADADTSKAGSTALMMAYRNNHTLVAARLIEAGADVNKPEMRVDRVAAATAAISYELQSIRNRVAAVQLRIIGL